MLSFSRLTRPDRRRGSPEIRGFIAPPTDGAGEGGITGAPPGTVPFSAPSGAGLFSTSPSGKGDCPPAGLRVESHHAHRSAVLLRRAFPRCARPPRRGGRGGLLRTRERKTNAEREGAKTAKSAATRGE